LSNEQANGDFSIIRLDGRDFHTITEDMSFERPFNLEFALSLVKAGKAVFRNKIRPLFAYLVSDEINFIYSEEVILGHLDKNLDKISHSLSGQVSKIFCNVIGYLPRRKMPFFDWNAFRTDRSGMLLYLTERQEWAYLNFLRGYAFWIKISSGLTSMQARESLQGLDSPALRDLINSSCIDLEELPLWQHRGILIRQKRGSTPFEREPSDIYELTVDLKPSLFKSREGKLYLLNVLSR
jgi:tRNA(His) 5'-end guanylyltransferase